MCVCGGGGEPCPPPGDLPNARIKPRCLMSTALAGGFFISLSHLGSRQLGENILDRTKEF